MCKMSKNSNTKFTEREIYPQLLNWLDEPEIVAIAGPRQAGKTTLLVKLREELAGQNAVYVSFEDTDQLASFSHSPREFIQLYLKEGQKTYFLFDEFQYVNQAGKVLKLLFDEYPQAKFIITGSSSLKIREIASFLVGRVIFFNLYPFSFAEYLRGKDEVLYKLWLKFNCALKNFFSGEEIVLPKILLERKLAAAFEEYLTFGGYPAVVTSEPAKKKERLGSLVETYIEKDIVKYLQIGNFLDFRNFTTILSSQIGGLINYSSLASDVSIGYREARKFLGALEKTFVIRLLSPYSSNKISEIRKSPKAYFIDLGLRNMLLENFGEIRLRADKGTLVENFVFQNLFYRKDTKALNFWRTKQGAEVDFILKFHGKIVPVEVKYQDFHEVKISRSFRNFLKNYQEVEQGVILTKNFSALSKFGNTRLLFLPVYSV